jgi:hypothetical protein
MDMAGKIGHIGGHEKGHEQGFFLFAHRIPAKSSRPGVPGVDALAAGNDFPWQSNKWSRLGQRRLGQPQRGRPADIFVPNTLARRFQKSSSTIKTEPHMFFSGNHSRALGAAGGLVAFTLLLLSGSAFAGDDSDDKQSHHLKAEILWDQFGIPIFTALTC